MILHQESKYTLISFIVHESNWSQIYRLAWKYEDDEIAVNCFRPRAGRDRPAQAIDHLNFKQSPFFKPLVRLASIKVCPGMYESWYFIQKCLFSNFNASAAANNYRQSRLFQFTLTDANRKLLATSNAVDDRPPYQIRFYCSQYNGNTSNLLVELPSVCELKVNDTVIQGSVRSTHI